MDKPQIKELPRGTLLGRTCPPERPEVTSEHVVAWLMTVSQQLEQNRAEMVSIKMQMASIQKMLDDHYRFTLKVEEL